MAGLEIQGFRFVNLLFLLVLPTAYAGPVFQRISTEQGLPYQEIQVIAQDRVGFLWIGSSMGLTRYDGIHFFHYSHDPGNETTLSSNHITAILSDRNGQLWIGGDAGLSRMEGETFLHYRHDPEDPNSLSHDIIHFIHEDQDGNLWIGAEEGLNRLDPKTNQIQRFTHHTLDHTSLSSDRVRCVARDSQGRLWFGTDGGGLNVYDGSGFQHFRHNPQNPESLASDHILALSFSRDDVLAVGFKDGGLDHIDPETNQITHFYHNPQDPDSLPKNPIHTLLHDSNNTLWMGTDSGLSSQTEEKHSFDHYRHDPRDSDSLSHSKVQALFQDRGGVLWVGSPNGLNKWNVVIGSFTHYKVDPLDNTKLNNNAVTAFAEQEDGSLWTATAGGGLNRLNRDTGQFRYYTRNPEDKTSLNSNIIMSLLVDRNQNLWVGSMDQGLSRYIPEIDGFQHIQAAEDPGPEALMGNGISCIAESRDGGLWIGTYGFGLSMRDPQTGNLAHFPLEPSNPNGLRDPRLVTMLEDHLGFIWLGTNGGGLIRFNRQTGNFSQFTHDPGDARSLRSNGIRHLYEDSRNRLWAATTGGLHLAEPGSREQARISFKRYTRKNGLLNDTVYGILEDDQGLIWLSCVKGLIRFDPEKERFTYYNDASRGLQHYEFNAAACFKSADGRLYFGGINGFNAFHSSEILTNQHKPPVALTGFFKMNQNAVGDANPWDLRRVEIEHRDSLVTFEFAALDYTAPEKNQYRYMLEGFDKGWINGDQLRAPYTNIDAGNYVFRVQAANSDGIWNEEGLRVQVTVKPAPWMSKPALGGYLFLFFSFIFLVKRNHAGKLAREAEFNRELEREVEARARDLKEQNHQLAEVNRKLSETSLTDPLTGLRNRLYLQSRFMEHQSEENLIFLVFDLDNLKNINTAQGQGAGDLVLIQVRQNLEKFGLKSALFCRLGGDEFLIICPCPDEEAASWLAENVRKRIATTRFAFGNKKGARMTCSLGYTFFPFSGTQPDLVNWEQALIIAARALAAAKKAGKNRWLGLLPNKTHFAEDFFQKFNQDPHAFIEDGSLKVQSSTPGPIVLAPQQQM